MKIHHTTIMEGKDAGICYLCDEPFKMYWKDKEEKNGRSDTTSIHQGKKVHYYCIPSAKSLKELNDERKSQIHE